MNDKYCHQMVDTEVDAETAVAAADNDDAAAEAGTVAAADIVDYKTNINRHLLNSQDWNC